MRKVFAIVVMVAMAGLGIGEAVSQVRLPQVRAQQTQVRRVPKVQMPLIIPPSAAMTAAMRAIPGAKAIGVKPRGNMYIIKLKQGNTVRQVRVNGVTGVVLP